MTVVGSVAEICLGVYANVASPGTLAEGDPLELEAPAAASAPAAVARSGATALKRGALRAFDALLPRGE